MKIYQVGGSVRDAFLNLKTKDYDYAVEVESYKLMKETLEKEGYKIFLEKPEYMSLRAKRLSDNEVADFTVCRIDGYYSDARRPDSVQVGDIYSDLARRDFTCNAIAIDQDGTYIDPYNGQEDIKRKVLVAVGDPKERIKEDALRILRAFRMIIMKGFTPDHHLEEVLKDPDLPDLLKKISVERKREEVHRMMAHDTPGTIKLLGQYPELFPAIFTDGMWLMPTNKHAKSH